MNEDLIWTVVNSRVSEGEGRQDWVKEKVASGLNLILDISKA